jgi:hypothetical protein
MLIATILGVCLVPMLYVLVERIIGGRKVQAPATTAPPAVAPAHGSH